MAERPLILLSNDDGVDAEGRIVLHEALEPIADVYTVAPEFEQSARSHAISLHTTLRHHVRGPQVHSVEGTPADCVYVALYRTGLLPRWPDLVVSGINHGANLAADIHYSGTVAAAREAALRGIPAVAFSLLPGGNLALSGQFARRMCERLLGCDKPDDQPMLLNVNFPPGIPNGARATCLGLRQYDEGVDVRTDPRGREYFWIGGPGGVTHPPVPGSDTEAIDEGFISITPISLRVSHAGHMGLAAYAAGPHKEPPE